MSQFTADDVMNAIDSYVLDLQDNDVISFLSASQYTGFDKLKVLEKMLATARSVKPNITKDDVLRDGAELALMSVTRGTKVTKITNKSSDNAKVKEKLDLYGIKSTGLGTDVSTGLKSDTPTLSRLQILFAVPVAKAIKTKKDLVLPVKVPGLLDQYSFIGGSQVCPNDQASKDLMKAWHLKARQVYNMKTADPGKDLFEQIWAQGEASRQRVNGSI